MSQTLEKLEQDKKELESQVWRNRSPPNRIINSRFNSEFAINFNENVFFCECFECIYYSFIFIFPLLCCQASTKHYVIII